MRFAIGIGVFSLNINAYTCIKKLNYNQMDIKINPTCTFNDLAFEIIVTSGHFHLPALIAARAHTTVV